MSMRPINNVCIRCKRGFQGSTIGSVCPGCKPQFERDHAELDAYHEKRKCEEQDYENKVAGAGGDTSLCSR